MSYRKDQNRTDTILSLLQRSQSSGIRRRYPLCTHCGSDRRSSFGTDSPRYSLQSCRSAYRTDWLFPSVHRQHRFRLPDRPAIHREQLPDCTLSPISCRWCFRRSAQRLFLQMLCWLFLPSLFQYRLRDSCLPHFCCPDPHLRYGLQQRWLHRRLLHSPRSRRSAPSLFGTTAPCPSPVLRRTDFSRSIFRMFQEDSRRV